jgi:hypothetical protein
VRALRRIVFIFVYGCYWLVLELRLALFGAGFSSADFPLLFRGGSAWWSWASVLLQSAAGEVGANIAASNGIKTV